MRAVNTRFRPFLALLFTFALQAAWGAALAPTASPNGKLVATPSLDDAGHLSYTVTLGGQTVLGDSPLGFTTDAGSLAEGLSLVSVSEPEKIDEHYTLLHGKTHDASVNGTRRVYRFKNAAGLAFSVAFQATDTYVAFQYRLGDDASAVHAVSGEATGFQFPAGSRAWMQPLHQPKTGFAGTNPSYEADHVINIPVGTPAESDAGWAFPALFRSGDNWVLLSETALYDQYCATRLAQNSPGGLYRIKFPQPGEGVGTSDPTSPTITLPFEGPWRTLVISPKLADIIATTAAWDLARPSEIEDTSYIKPGLAAWSWLPLKDNLTVPITRNFINMAAQLGWRYCLVDAYWDTKLGYDTMKQLSDEAQAKGVNLLVWYNSNGNWNTAPQTPKDKMFTHEERVPEFKRLAAMGIKGVKVDFFGGDKQVVLRQYMGILRDAAAEHMLVNFHGATLPRGWSRTFPNLITTEAVKGTEYTTFDQRNADTEPANCVTLCFTRNVVAPMDYTPVWFPMASENVRRITTDAFELALPIVFESGITHFGIQPSGLTSHPAFMTDYLKSLPPTWDETRLVAGEPGKYAVFARRAGDKWFVAGINGEKTPRELTLDLGFISDESHLMRDGEKALELQTLAPGDLAALKLTLPAHGGFELWPADADAYDPVAEVQNNPAYN